MLKSSLSALIALSLSVLGLPTIAEAQNSRDPNVEGVDSNDPEMNAAIDKALRKLPEFLEVL
ncbi:MAG: hypothetical protein AAFY60_21875 [Myxococcota bacterium]